MNQGKSTGNIRPLFITIYVTNWILLTTIMCILTFSIFDIFESGSSCSRGTLIALFSIELGSLIAQIVFYQLIVNAINSVDLKLLQYAIDNNCSDEPLHRSLHLFVERRSKDKVLA